MRALCIVEPGRAAVVDIPTPPIGAGQVAIELAYVGFCGSDLTSYRGLNPLVSYPRVPGHEIAGTISALAPDVAGLKIGQHVTVMPYFNCGSCRPCRLGRPNACQNNQTMGVQREGAMTARVVVPAAKVIPVDGLPLPELALVEPCAVGFHAVRRSQLQPGETALVLGCGMIGLGVAMGALRAGARVIAFDLSDAKLETARKLGASVTVNPSKDGWRDELAKHTPGGIDVAFEAVGAEATFLQAVELVGSCGRVVYIGYAKSPIAFETKAFITKELDIRGSRNALPDDFQDVIQYLRDNPGVPSLVVSKTVPIEEAVDALAAWHEKPGEFTKILVDLRS